MTSWTPHVALIGGGMIAHDQILPSLYQLQRQRRIGIIDVCARRPETLDALAANAQIQRAFPGHAFRPHAGRYQDLLAQLPPRQVVILALPDQIHFPVVMDSLAAHQHVICVKPLVQRAADSVTIEQTARQRGLFVGVEYHKRLDDRSLMARLRYRQGQFGEFKLGHACLHEKWYYRHSNFQNWFDKDSSDAFTYVGCHYVDLVHFITGLRPTGVSVYGIPDRFPNGVEGYLWADARVTWENGACLNVQNSLSYPQHGGGPNLQGLTMFCTGAGEGAMIRHSDQYRGLEYTTVDGYSEPSPDYFQYVDLGGPGLSVVGYGFRSLDHLLRAAERVEHASDRTAELRAIDEEALLATPANSRFNELVVEAARLSLQHDGRTVAIDYAMNSVRP
jgi:predicted dehydrogenase